MTTETLDAARRYVAAGLGVIPIRRGSKTPDGTLLEATTGQKDRWVASDSRAIWRVYCERMPTDAELVIWFAESEAGIGIVGGAVSGGLVRIDFEHRACLSTWHAELARSDPALAQIAAGLPVAQTGKGHHVYLRMPDPPGYVLLSSWGADNDILVLAETQGEGCYCVAPPSMVYRPNGTLFQYAWTAGLRASYGAIPTLDQATATALLDAARFLAFWEHPLSDDGFNARACAGRQGLLLRKEGRSWSESWHVGWADLHKLRAYLDRYAALLTAVESAPAPPPSYGYDEVEEDDYDN